MHVHVSFILVYCNELPFLYVVSQQYLQSLESKVKEISNLNESLRVQNETLKRRVSELEVEVCSKFDCLSGLFSETNTKTATSKQTLHSLKQRFQVSSCLTSVIFL